MNRYTRCLVSLTDGTLLTVCIDRYLSATDRSSQQVLRGDRAYHDLVQALSKKTGTGAYASMYRLDGARVHLESFKMPFVGKGSPFDVRQAALAASWCGLVDAHSILRYCEENMGLDCNGFASNLFRLDRNTAISSFDDPARRLDSPLGFGPRTLLVWLDTAASGRTHSHIAVVERVTSIDERRAVADLQIVHSEGGRGLHQERLYKRFGVDEVGKIFFDQGDDPPRVSMSKRIYALPPPNDSIPRD